jgi:small-conductance mechanosensitive channel
MEHELFWRIISDYGDLASVGGFLLSLVGFGLTIWSAQGARKAAEQARQSVLQIRSQLIANEISGCLQTVKAILRYIHKGAWTLASESCVEAGVQLSRTSNNREFTFEENSRLSRMIDDLKLIHVQIEDIRSQKEKGKQISQRVPSKLNDMLMMLSRLEGRLRPRSVEF